MKNHLLLALVSTTVSLHAAPPARLHQAIDPTETFRLAGHTRSLVHTAQDLGDASPSLPLPQLALHFTMSAAQSADLKELLVRQRDQTSKWYHSWLTPEEFGTRYGMNDRDLKKIVEWLENAGFTSIEVSRSRTFVRMTGSAAQANSLFGVQLHQYNRNGKSFYANASDPALPKALAGMVSGLTGLTNQKVHPFVRRNPRPKVSVGIDGNHFLGPDDLATIYDLRTLYNQGTDGTGQTIAVVGQSDVNLADIESFQAATGLPIKDPKIISAGLDPGSDPDNETEADLDLEWTGAVARGANIVYVNSPNALDSAVFAIENNIAPIVSISYGLCEAALTPDEMNSYNAVFQQANAQGITVVVASGDTGAAACDVGQTPTGAPETIASNGLAVSFPASSPYVTALGGTEFDEAQGTFWNSAGHALSYIPEIAWNDTSVFKVLSGSGGGASSQFKKPDWQLGAGVPADGQRDLPDIALSASPSHDPYLICSAGSCSNGIAPPVSQIYFVGGTSCAAPVFAGILALLNQSTNGQQGNVNPGLYSLASFNSGVFHDIELGDNRVPCVAGTTGCVKNSLGYAAGPGYDQVTGLGSIDAVQFIDQWGADFQIASTPSSLSFGSGGSGITSIQVNRFANFTGTVSFTCNVAGSLTNTTCAVTGPLSGGSGTVTVTVSNTSAAKIIYWFRNATPNSVLFWAIGTALLALFVSQQRRWLRVGLALSLVIATSCGSGSSGGIPAVNPTRTGNVTVTATSGTLQHVITIPVTIS